RGQRKLLLRRNSKSCGTRLLRGSSNGASKPRASGVCWVESATVSLVAGGLKAVCGGCCDALFISCISGFIPLTARSQHGAKVTTTRQRQRCQPREHRT